MAFQTIIWKWDIDDSKGSSKVEHLLRNNGEKLQGHCQKAFTVPRNAWGSSIKKINKNLTKNMYYSKQG